MFFLALTVLVILSTLYFATSVDRELIAGVAAVATLLVAGHGFVQSAGFGPHYAWTQSKLHTAVLPGTSRGDAIRDYVYGDYGYDYDITKREGGLYFEGHEYRYGDALSELPGLRHSYGTSEPETIPKDREPRPPPVQLQPWGLSGVADSQVGHEKQSVSTETDPARQVTSIQTGESQTDRTYEHTSLEDSKSAQGYQVPDYGRGFETEKTLTLQAQHQKREENAKKGEQRKAENAKKREQRKAEKKANEEATTSQPKGNRKRKPQAAGTSALDATHTANRSSVAQPVTENEGRESGDAKCAPGEQQLQMLKQSFRSEPDTFYRVVVQLGLIEQGRTGVEDKNIDMKVYCWVTLLKLVEYLLHALEDSRNIQPRPQMSDEFYDLVNKFKTNALQLGPDYIGRLRRLQKRASVEAKSPHGTQSVDSTLTS
jgi:hypothetical protein